MVEWAPYVLLVTLGSLSGPDTHGWKGRCGVVVIIERSHISLRIAGQ
jgi:hypothetical protein